MMTVLIISSFSLPFQNIVVDVTSPPRVMQTIDRLATEKWNNFESEKSKPQSVNTVFYINFLYDLFGQE